MGNYTREEILAMAEEEDVEFIRLQFTDMFGTLKNIAITARELPRALDNQCVVYGSHIAGIVGEKEPDLILYPDYNTFSILPWRPQQGKVARLICDMRRADGSEHEMSSRYILKKTAQAAEEAGYTCYVDPECEFFLFHIDDNGMPTTVSHEKAGYLDVSPVDLGENARRDMVLTLEDMGFEVESSHHETAQAAEEAGYTCYVDPECEFFLFHIDDNGMPTTVSHEKAGYLDVSPVDLGENARRDMVLTLEDMGFEVESSHHETAPAQHEIALHYGEAREMADEVITFKMAVRTVAKRHGLHATFMPKPRREVNGSAMHIHFSLFKNGKNIFVDPEDPTRLSEEAYYFIGGLLAHSREMTLITNPLVNSYKRLVPGFDAPTELTWTRNNQNSLVRIPRVNGADTRIELRSPDAASNPYLVFAVCLAAGLDGIQKKIYPTKASNRSLSESDQKEQGIENLPENLREAITLFEDSSWMKEILGEAFCKQYAQAKRKEWLRYSQEISDWEIEEYLYRI